MYGPLLSELAKVSTTQLLLVITVLLVVVYVFYSTSYHGVWEKAGIPGPKPWPIIDHMLELRHGLNMALDKWFAQYGKTFGVYGLQPHMPTLVTKDLDLLKQILVKDFDNFSSRYRPIRTWSSINKGLSSVNGGTWKRQRHVTTPLFTARRMRMMLMHVTASANNLTELIKQSSSRNELIPVKDFASKFSTEVIARIGFGVDSHAVSKDETEFAHFCRKLVMFRSKLLKFAVAASYFFPPIQSLLHYVSISSDFINKKADAYFVNILKSTIEERQAERVGQNEEKKHPARDMLDLLMDAGVNEGDARLVDANSKTLSTDEIIGNSTLLILAGVETVSTAFQSILYCVALYPDIQERVVSEIDNVIPQGEAIEYEHLSQLKYTEQVINECLRLFPLLAMIFRKTAETRTYNGMTIPKGALVQIPLGMIMRDPEIWPDPDKFDPERFSPTNKATREPIAFLPFGYGPRVCLGQRLAMLELKVVLACLLRNFRFQLSERTEPKKGEIIKMHFPHGITLQPKVPVQLEAILRE